MGKKSLAHATRGTNKCQTEGCAETYHASGYCRKHYVQQRYANRTTECSIDGCINKAHLRGWCTSHYSNFWHNGDPLRFRRKTTGRTSAERFWKRVRITADINRCWEWQRATIKGYGILIIDGEHWKAHRYAWYLHHGRRPKEMILHSCDNPPCCNPHHLREGVTRENAIDMMTRRRHRGQSLVKQDVIAVKELLAEGQSHLSIHKATGIHRRSIKGIQDGTHWSLMLLNKEDNLLSLPL